MRYFIVVRFLPDSAEVTGVKLIHRQNASLGCALTNAFSSNPEWIQFRTASLPFVPGRDTGIPAGALHPHLQTILHTDHKQECLCHLRGFAPTRSHLASSVLSMDVSSASESMDQGFHEDETR